MSKIVGIIPARYASTRFPGKMLHPLCGKPLIQHVWERVSLSKELDEVIIATDDIRIAEVAFNFGAKVSMTRADHPSGSDRVAEVAAKLKNATHILNIQGDEPSIHPKLIDALCKELRKDSSIRMITAATPLEDPEEIQNPNCVKVIFNQKGNAIYFSRLPIPYYRDKEKQPDSGHFLHLGIYGFKRSTLLKFVSWPKSPLESAEELEQLRALDHQLKIKIHLTPHRSFGIDSPEDAAAFEKNDKNSQIS